MSKKDKAFEKALGVGCVVAIPVAFALSSSSNVVLSYFFWWAVISFGAYFLIRPDE